MKMIPSDPDIETIIGRIRNGYLDLQPDFQRGEVWSESKKRRLIDTILRDWHIPPIHVIEKADSRVQEVLDGQQRLVAIRDFVNGLIRVDGTIEPRENSIAAAHEKTYETLPPALRTQFDTFTIRIFRLIDFRPDEPGELFYRLNQPTSLTAAEQRNAFFGPVRAQVRELCEKFDSMGLTSEHIGFSNSRMAYDDIVSKIMLSLERKSLRHKLTAAGITERYRMPQPFSADVVNLTESSLKLLGSVAPKVEFVRFNKATLFSWLWLAARALREKSTTCFVDMLPEFLTHFELSREWMDQDTVRSKRQDFFPRILLEIFINRSSLRVADVSSVLLRDAVLSYCYFEYATRLRTGLDGAMLSQIYRHWHPILLADPAPSEAMLLDALDGSNWGTIP